MFKKINSFTGSFILSAVLLIAAVQLSYADANSFTVNVPNTQGSYTAVVIQQSGSGYVGPQGEYYPQFPSVAQLQAMYGNGTNPPVVSNTNEEVAVTIPPPALPVYVQPDPPSPDYIWTPGYWAYDSFSEDYYWVPGTWVTAPNPGLLWTPGYWYWRDGQFVYSDGYWGDHIGFYGGVHYGHGYDGQGFSGGEWHNGHFANRTINVDTTNGTKNMSSYNGGPGGIQAQPTPEEQSFMHAKHIPPTSAQRVQLQTARSNTDLRASANHGKPAIAATAKPGVFKGQGVVAARQAGAFYNKTKPVASGVRVPQAENLGNTAHRQALPQAQVKRASPMMSKPVVHPQSQVKIKPNPKPKPKPKPKPPQVPPVNGENAPNKNPS